MNDFFSNLFEFYGLYYNDYDPGRFASTMYSQGFYVPVGLIMLISVAVLTLIYYFVINHTRLSKPMWWILYGVIIGLINFVSAWTVADTKLSELYASEPNYPYSGLTDFFPFALIVFFWAFVFYLVFSAIVKRFSINCRHTPWRSLFPKH